MRREEERSNQYCLNKSNQVSVEASEDKKSTDKTKASKVIEEVFDNVDKSKNLFVEETVNKKFSYEIKAITIGLLVGLTLQNYMYMVSRGNSIFCFIC